MYCLAFCMGIVYLETKHTFGITHSISYDWIGKNGIILCFLFMFQNLQLQIEGPWKEYELQNWAD